MVRVSKSSLKTPETFNLILSRYVSGEIVVIDTLIGLREQEERTVSLGNASEGLYFLQVQGETNLGEFIWSKQDDDLVIESDFWSFKNGQLGVLNSEENAAYAQLLEAKHSFDSRFGAQQSLFGLLSPFQKDYYRRMAQLEDTISLSIASFNSELKQVRSKHENTYAGRVLVPLNLLPELRDPIFSSRYDGFLSLMSEQYFAPCDLTQASVLNHYALEDKVLSYLDSYSEKSAAGAEKGIDVIMEAMNDFSKVRSYVYSLLLKNFINFKTETLARYLMDKHADGCDLDLTFEELKRLNEMRSLMIGGTLPNVNLLDVNDRPHDLGRYANNHKYTIVYIWISWCAKCKKQSPEIASLYNEYRKRGLGVYAISLDEKKEEWVMAMEKINATYPNLSEQVPIKNSTVALRYGLSTTPKIFIIDSESRIVMKDVYGDALQEQISNLFSAK